MHKLHCSLRPHVCQARYASTSSTPYPFPSHAHPTAHQIFHLPIGASQQDVKARYYELVRVHHPDSSHGRDLSPLVRRHRFQAITAAYDVLRGRKSAASMNGPGDIYRQEIERRRRAQAAYAASRMRSEHAYQHPSGAQWSASADDRWKDRIILFVGLMALGAGLGPALVWPSYTASYQAHLTASQNLAAARREAREHGEERRREISKRVKEYKEKEAREQAEREGKAGVA
ncbi:hypothetical protein K466DRAFT_554769 [Polyporus arcularius HHB13444]|uniref:J domain-containing protein n=1 Tax=Polyporus arcularius HHB13444 TaxID=1314778 RepID=A0A5C3P1U7_9APHY|nr:hypothetical protein K466DRAFT_554769 [Polyporus arcularius HHB13444]